MSMKNIHQIMFHRRLFYSKISLQLHRNIVHLLHHKENWVLIGESTEKIFDHYRIVGKIKLIRQSREIRILGYNSWCVVGIA